MAHALTINEAAETTGWSPRMLRYIDRVGLISPPRSEAGYRLYRAEELQRLRTLRGLLDRFGLGLAEVAFAKRQRAEPGLEGAIDAWLAAQAVRPAGVAEAEWLSLERDRHAREWPARERESGTDFEPFLVPR